MPIKNYAMRIIVVEDNESLRKGLCYRLEDEGYAIDALEDGLAADEFLRSEGGDLVVLDINLPGQSGLDVLRAMRRRNDPRPVILLTARNETEDRVTGLDAGADDYLVKPFAMDELVARVRALGRRRTVAPIRRLQVGALRLELEPLQLFSQEGQIDIPRRELSLFSALAQSGVSTVSKTQLLDAMYGAGSDVDESVVEVYVSRLRRRIAPFGMKILVKRGIGYVLDFGR